MNAIKQLFFISVFGFVSNCSAVSNDETALTHGNEIFDQTAETLLKQDLRSEDRALIKQTKISVSESKNTTFNEQELITAFDLLFKRFDQKLSPENNKSLLDARQALITRLKNFKVTGFAWAIDPNGAFFWDTQDPVFDLVFKNAAGEIKTKKIQACIESIGLKIEFAVNINFIFFLNTDDLSCFETNEPIELGKGGELGIAWSPINIHYTVKNKDQTLSPMKITATYTSFKELTGGMLMISIGFGLVGTSISIVTGGTLTSVN